jgi:UDP-N-acetylglucosamine transferase subunit ALG13
MIFVTVGVQLPFDRLIDAVDQWAAQHAHPQIFAQTGNSKLQPGHIQHQKFLEPDQFGEKCREADLIIGHAGMGSILTALEYGKPLLVMPRRAALDEHRNDHQLATVERFRSLSNVHVAMDEMDLTNMLGKLSELTIEISDVGESKASPLLIETLANFVNGSTSG